MTREDMVQRIDDKSESWDFIIIGGGATGVGCAIEAASRGYHVLLLEQDGTSSRSTKLVHGGVRYLKQGNVSLVLEALKERGILHKNAPHLVHNLPFIVPNYDWWEGPFYGIGLKLYDMLAGKEGFGDSRVLSKDETITHIPTIETMGLRGGVIYYDGQFDDARLVINMVQTAAEQGATLINYMRVSKLQKKANCISGLIAHDLENDKEYQLSARVVINATGVFSDQIIRLDDTIEDKLISPSQGIHIVLDKSFLPGDSAIMIPETDDGRVLFAIPWHDRVIVGTTDTPVDEAVLEPVPLPSEIEFLLSHAARYLLKDPSSADVLSVFAGLRPLVASGNVTDTATLSRDHTIHISPSGLVTITGGKWTTYRKMAEDTVDHALVIAQLEHIPSVTRDLPIHGYHKNPDAFGDLADYGSDASEIMSLIKREPVDGQKLHHEFSITPAHVRWALSKEMARTVEDFLARRTRCLILDAKASLSIAPQVARIMADHLNRDDTWINNQLSDYTKLVDNYLPG